MKPILLVEDEAFIAIETEMALMEHGQGPVAICANARQAHDWLADYEPRAALLDFNLGGGETSEAVAAALLERGIPMALLTGYTEATLRSGTIPRDTPRFSKPCHVEDVVIWLESLAL